MLLQKYRKKHYHLNQHRVFQRTILHCVLKKGPAKLGITLKFGGYISFFGGFCA